MIEVLEQAMELYESKRERKKVVKESIQQISREEIKLNKSNKL